MTSTIYTASADSDHERARRLTLPVAAVSFVVALALSVQWGHGAREWLLEAAVEIVLAALVFGLVVPRGLRHESAGGRGIVMAAIALLLVVPAFWSGLPLLLGAAAAILGYAGKRAHTGSGRATASLVLGLLAVVAYLAAYLADFLHVHGLG